MRPRLYVILGITAIVMSWFRPTVGQFTGVTITVWFLGTQPVWRGAALVALIAAISAHTIHSAVLATALIGLIPLVAHRAASSTSRRFVTTLFLPLAGVVVAWAGGAIGIKHFAATPLFMAAWTLWFAAVVNWMWDTERVRPILFLIVVATLAWAAARLVGVPHEVEPILIRDVAAGLSALTVLILAALAIRDRSHHPWALHQETIPLLRSPASGESLMLNPEGGNPILFSKSGERFDFVEGLPNFLRPSDVTGLNHKYTQLYDTIAGFYDTTQRVVAALLYGGAENVHREYLKNLTVRSGDRVLETSVGTGLNLKSLPAAIRMMGVDISRGMLRVCKQNLVRWGREMELFRANAESLPFASDLFDVVFHVGGINFFSDKRKAVLEMIRVAKPGALILIADETEKHAKTYEKIPVTGAYFKNREQPVIPVLDLVPTEMADTNMQTVWNKRFYVITFRKPVTGVENQSSLG